MAEDIVVLDEFLGIDWRHGLDGPFGSLLTAANFYGWGLSEVEVRPGAEVLGGRTDTGYIQEIERSPEGYIFCCTTTGAFRVLESTGGTDHRSVAPGACAIPRVFDSAGSGSPLIVFSAASAMWEYNPSGGVYTNVQATANVDDVAGRQMPVGYKDACVSPIDGRFLVLAATAGPHAAASNQSRLWASEPGNYKKWYTTRFIDFLPADGEECVAVVPWNNLVFVFKESKFFVIHSVTTLSNGSPQFNYHTRDFGQGVAERRAVAVGTEGVYFVNENGLWLTDGGRPTRVGGGAETVWTRGWFEGDWSPGNAPAKPRFVALYGRMLMVFGSPSLAANFTDHMVYALNLDTGTWWVFRDGNFSRYWTTWVNRPELGADFSAERGMPLVSGYQPQNVLEVNRFHRDENYVTGAAEELDGLLVFAPVKAPAGEQLVVRDLMVDGDWRFSPGGGASDVRLRLAARADSVQSEPASVHIDSDLDVELWSSGAPGLVHHRTAQRGRRIFPVLEFNNVTSAAAVVIRKLLLQTLVRPDSSTAAGVDE